MTTQVRTAVTHRIADSYPLRLQPERKVYRVGSPYLFRHPSESLAVATCAFLTAHYRLVHGRVQRFSAPSLALRLNGAHAPAELWSRASWSVSEAAVAYEPPPTIPTAPFAPVSVLTAESAADVLSALAEVGPVLALLPWAANYDVSSRAYGVDWIGPDGTATRGAYTKDHRGVLIKGVAWKFRGVCIQDGQRGDHWLPFAELDRLFGEGAKALSASF